MEKNIAVRIYIDKNVVGFLAYVQGRDQNEKNCYFNIYLLPEHNGNGYRQLLFNKMLIDESFDKSNKQFLKVDNNLKIWNKECEQLKINIKKHKGVYYLI